MSKLKRMTIHSCPEAVQDILTKLGENLKLSRKRRNMTMSQLAEAMFVTRQTVSKMEAGDPAVSISTYILAVFCLQREKEFKDFLSPRNDVLGCMLDEMRHIQRERIKLENDDSLNF